MMANYVCSEDEVSNMERNKKKIDDFTHMWLDHPKGIPSVNIGADHDIFHLADIEYLELARVVLVVLDR